jgi:hypothetical protein
MILKILKYYYFDKSEPDCISIFESPIMEILVKIWLLYKLVSSLKVNFFHKN